MAMNSSTSSADNTTVDTAVLQHQNQRLVQQMDAQKHELHVLEGKFQELKDKQTSNDDTLITLNKLWNQLDDDLILLGIRAGGNENGLQALDRAGWSQGSIPSCPWEETFLCRLLEAGPIKRNGANETAKYVEEALAARHSSTMNLMKHLEDIIEAQKAKTDSIASNLHEKLPAEGQKGSCEEPSVDDLMREEANNLRKVIDILHSKHREYEDEIRTYVHSHSMDRSEIKRLTGELEKSMAELEESGRKLVNLKMQKDGTSGVHIPVLNAVNGSMFPDRNMGLQKLKDSIEESKMLAASRLSELQEAQEYNLNLSKQFQALQNKLKDDKFVVSSRPYTILSDQLQHLNTELERYKGLTDSLQADRTQVILKEKELIEITKSVDDARSAISTAEHRVEELELHLQQCIIDRNELEIKLEEVEQDLDERRKDVKVEFSVMASALSKEVGMMEAQLIRCKETAHKAIRLREEAHTLKALLSRKTSEIKGLADRSAEQVAEIKSLTALIEKLQKDTQEQQFVLEMHLQECFDNRNVTEIKESERRAHVQAEVLRNALEEHSLELRVRAANEAENTCHQRLAEAEAEIADLRAKLDASERDVLEVSEAIIIKDREAAAYISEIEAIGQAYEDMQMQNQRLLQKVSEGDDYNIKLVSESVKTKQVQKFLLAEKQVLAKQLQQVNVSLESLKLKISCSEEQMKDLLSEARKTSLENRHFVTKTEHAKWELAAAMKELKWLRAAVASSEKEFEENQRKVAELQMELKSARAEKKSREELLKEMNHKVAEVSSESEEAAIQKLQDEIQECKATLKCGVCFDRPKEVVITKCYHLFCNQCIQRNLEIRHRKCPGCGTAFGQNDVRFVNF